MTPKLKTRIRIVCWTIFTLLILYFFFILFSFIAAVVSAPDEARYWTEWQRAHIAALEKAYAEGTAEKIDEDSFCDFDLSSGGEIKINRLRYLATHNSYKQGTTKATDVFYNYALPTLLGKKYDYEFDSITDQFNFGIRSIEIDLGKIREKDGFSISVYHNALTETGSSAIDVELGLKEMKMWSDYNTVHLPIIVLVEPKGGMIGKYVDFDAEAMTEFDGMLRKIFGSSLLTPSDVLDVYSDFAQVRAADAYPSINETRGKFIFLLHQTDVLEEYMSRDESMRSQSMFIALTTKNHKLRSPELKDRALFAIINDPQFDSENQLIAEMLNENFMIRTRLDEFAFINDKRFSRALNSGANILSTDYPPASKDRYGYTVKITEDGKTVLLKD